MRWRLTPPSLLRGLAQRGSTNVMVLLVALAAAAAATTGPTSYAASTTSILRDTVAATPVLGRGYEVTQTGGVTGIVDPLSAQVGAAAAADFGGTATVRRLFAPPVTALETTAEYPHPAASVPLVWRSGVCAQLAVRGACPQARGQVVISESLARSNGWRIGQRLHFDTWGALTVTGVYRVPPATDYFFDRATSYFAYELAPPGATGLPVYDAMFTPRATIDSAPLAVQGTAVVADVLAARDVHAGDVARLSAGATALVNDQALSGEQAVVTSDIPATSSNVEAGWSSLAVPVVLITAQLLTLAWLLLFVVVTDAVDARGPEIALVKLRGHGRWRTFAFGLSEPVALIAVSLPAGALAGWAVSGLLGGLLLRPGTPVALPPLGWAAAGIATVGGLAAVVLAARRTLVRPVVEQWRRSGRGATERGWVIDTVLVVGAVAGLVELSVTGQVAHAGQRVLSLLVPGLLGLAVAVVASRLLPLACRGAARATRRWRSLAAYLALRQVARRPGGARTMIVLAASFALATFALAAWSVNRANDRAVAAAQVGASTVLTVSVPAGRDLAGIVERADPSGRKATAVEVLEGTPVTLAVQPQRFARIASWRRSWAQAPLAALAATLDPPEPPVVNLSGDALRVTVTVTSLSTPGEHLAADVVIPDNNGPTPVDLGAVAGNGRTTTLTASLTGCPCALQDLTLSGLPVNGEGGAPPIFGTVTFSGMRQHRPSGWVDVHAGFDQTSHWRPGAVDVPPDVVTAGPSGLRWTFRMPSTQTPTLVSVNRPVTLPAIVSTALVGGRRGPFTGIGLDSRPLPLDVVAPVTAVPGAPADGIIVDLGYAEIAAAGATAADTSQVWLAAGAESAVVPRLRAAGVRVLAAAQETSAAAVLGRQGPGLASVLFLTDAAAAAALAAGGAILGLYLYGRRRRYELAALAASGVTRRALVGSLVAEQVVVLAFATVAGIGAGLAAIALALRSVPELSTIPPAPPLSYLPAAGPLAIELAGMVLVVLVVAVAASANLVRGVRLDQLREAPP